MNVDSVIKNKSSTFISKYVWYWISDDTQTVNTPELNNQAQLSKPIRFLIASTSRLQGFYVGPAYTNREILRIKNADYRNRISLTSYSKTVNFFLELYPIY